jgi:hypothetical protein
MVLRADEEDDLHSTDYSHVRRVENDGQRVLEILAQQGGRATARAEEVPWLAGPAMSFRGAPGLIL